LGNGGWSTLLNSAKGPLAINGQSPVPPPDIPGERLNLPPIPMPPPVDTSSQVSSQIDLSDQGQSSPTNQGNAHLPGQSTATNGTADTGTSPTSAAPPPQGNTFLNGPPPPPAGPPLDGPPLDGPPPPPGDVPPPPAGGPPPGPGPAPGPVDPAAPPPAPILLHPGA
jgi:hypothetical protein